MGYASLLRTPLLARALIGQAKIFEELLHTVVPHRKFYILHFVINKKYINLCVITQYCERGINPKNPSKRLRCPPTRNFLDPIICRLSTSPLPFLTGAQSGMFIWISFLGLGEHFNACTPR